MKRTRTSLEHGPPECYRTVGKNHHKEPHVAGTLKDAIGRLLQSQDSDTVNEILLNTICPDEDKYFQHVIEEYEDGIKFTAITRDGETAKELGRETVWIAVLGDPTAVDHGP